MTDLLLVVGGGARGLMVSAWSPCKCLQVRIACFLFSAIATHVVTQGIFHCFNTHILRRFTNPLPKHRILNHLVVPASPRTAPPTPCTLSPCVSLPRCLFQDSNRTDRWLDGDLSPDELKSVKEWQKYFKQKYLIKGSLKEYTMASTLFQTISHRIPQLYTTPRTPWGMVYLDPRLGIGC